MSTFLPSVQHYGPSVAFFFSPSFQSRYLPPRPAVAAAHVMLHLADVGLLRGATNACGCVLLGPVGASWADPALRWGILRGDQETVTTSPGLDA